MEYTVRIKKDTYLNILNSIGKHEPESGGIIACSIDNDIVDFYFDVTAGTGKISYIPSISDINKKVNEDWGLLKYHFGGIVHSHPLISNSIYPSNSDIKMAEKIMLHNNLTSLFLIIVQGMKLSTWNVVEYLHECSIDIKSYDLILF